MIKKRKNSQIKELTSRQLWELSDDKDIIIYQVEFIRYQDDIGENLFLVELEHEK